MQAINVVQKLEQERHVKIMLWQMAVAECTAVQNVDIEKEIKQTVEAVDKAVNRLGRLEREIIQRRYLRGEEEYDCLVCQELHLSERKYRRIKARAIYKLALMLRLEVMIDPEDPKETA